MSNFTKFFRMQTGVGGAAMAKINKSWTDKKNTDRQRSFASKASGGMFGFFVFGFFWFLIPMLIRLTINLALLAYCAVMGIMWGVGAMCDGIFLRGAKAVRIDKRQ